VAVHTAASLAALREQLPASFDLYVGPAGLRREGRKRLRSCQKALFPYAFLNLLVLTLTVEITVLSLAGGACEKVERGAGAQVCLFLFLRINGVKLSMGSSLSM
jgi:hypothetical protein